MSVINSSYSTGTSPSWPLSPMRVPNCVGWEETLIRTFVLVAPPVSPWLAKKRSR